MKRLKLLILSVVAMISADAMAGGILTNTTHSIRYLRMMARDGAIGIDGVYYNPAGVAFMPRGWHFSFNGMNVYQTRTIYSGMNVRGLEGTPYHQPFKMFGGDENGIKRFKGETSVPIMPAIQFKGKATGRKSRERHSRCKCRRARNGLHFDIVI